MSLGDWIIVGGAVLLMSGAFAAACVFALMGDEIAAKWRERRARRRG